jgi:hypothetical protein
MQAAAVALTLARCRIAIGVAAIAAPRLTAQFMGGPEAADGIAPVFARMLGARDIALGLGTVIALDRGKPVRGWIEGAALSDAVDCIASLLARDRIPPAVLPLAAGSGGAAALIGALISRQLDPPPPAQPGQPEAVATGHPDR